MYIYILPCSRLFVSSIFVEISIHPRPSQVIPRKDLPRIYTMCLPVKDRGGGAADLAEGDGEGELSLSSGLQDLEVSLGSFC